MTNEVLKFISDQINEEITKLSEDMARGTAKDHGDYKYACGIIRGYMLANGIIADTAHKVDNDDD